MAQIGAPAALAGRPVRELCFLELAPASLDQKRRKRGAGSPLGSSTQRNVSLAAIAATARRASRSSTDFKVPSRGRLPAADLGRMPSYTIRATDKETGEVRLMKVQAGTPMTEVIKQYAALSGIDGRVPRRRRQAAEDGQTAGRAVALTATQPPPSAVVDDGDEGDCSFAAAADGLARVGLLKKNMRLRVSRACGFRRPRRACVCAPSKLYGPHIVRRFRHLLTCQDLAARSSLNAARSRACRTVLAAKLHRPICCARAHAES